MAPRCAKDVAIIFLTKRFPSVRLPRNDTVPTMAELLIQIEVQNLEIATATKKGLMPENVSERMKEKKVLSKNPNSAVGTATSSGPHVKGELAKMMKAARREQNVQLMATETKTEVQAKAVQLMANETKTEVQAKAVQLFVTETKAEARAKVVQLMAAEAKAGTPTKIAQLIATVAKAGTPTTINQAMATVAKAGIQVKIAQPMATETRNRLRREVNRKEKAAMSDQALEPPDQETNLHGKNVNDMIASSIPKTWEADSKKVVAIKSVIKQKEKTDPHLPKLSNLMQLAQFA